MTQDEKDTLEREIECDGCRLISTASVLKIFKAHPRIRAIIEDHAHEYNNTIDWPAVWQEFEKK